MNYTVEDEYGDVKLTTTDFQDACQLAQRNDWWVRDESAVALYGCEDNEEGQGVCRVCGHGNHDDEPACGHPDPQYGFCPCPVNA